MALTTKYVNTAADSGGNGNNNTTSSGDGSHAYQSLNAWEAAQGEDLVSGTNTHIVYCDGTNDTTAVVVNAFTSDTTYFATIEGGGSTGYNDTGIWSTSYYNLTAAASNDYSYNPGVGTLSLASKGTTVNKLQIKNNNSSTTNALAYVVNFSKISNGTGCKLDKCILVCDADAGTSVGYLSHDYENTAGSIENTLMYSASSPSTASHISFNAVNDNKDASISLESCTIDCNNGTFGVSAGGKTWTINANNCAIVNYATLPGTEVSDNFTYCATDTGTEGTNEQQVTSMTDTFNDHANGDYRIKNTSSVLYDNGTATGAPSDDITGTTRTTDDIGAFQYVAITAGSTFVPKIMIY